MMERATDTPTFSAKREPPQAVLVGGSAGAIEVVSLLLGALAADFATPIVVLIHLPRHRPSALGGALRGRCRLAVREPVDKEPLAPATVYLAPPDYHLLIDPGPSFALSVDEPVNFSKPSIDVLFQSAAHVLGASCVGVLLSGASPDGAQGLRAIWEAGGLVAIQDPDDAIHGTMPKAGRALCPDAQVLSAKAICAWVQQLPTWQTSSGPR
jgi:two-component system chemotaxis response regulator CheB